MPITTKTIKRVFRYGGTEIPDPSPGSSEEAVLKLLTTTYPTFANAYLEGPSIESGKQVFVIKVAAGTKG